jgi:exoribonuclease-2
MKDGLVRADTLPLVFRVPGTESLPRGSRVRARITGIDLLTLDLHASAGRAPGRRPAVRRPPEKRRDDDEAEAVTR